MSAALHLVPPADAAHWSDDTARLAYESALPLLREDERLDEALAFMQRAAAHEPSSPLPLAGEAEAAWRKYYLTDAPAWLAHCREAVRRAELRGQDCAAVHRIAGLLEDDAGRSAQAVVRYQRATELPSVNADAWRRLGAVYQRMNQMELALAATRRAVEVEPGYFKTHQDLGAFHFRRGDYGAATPEFRAAVALAPSVPRLRSVLAASLMNSGEFAAAERELRTGLELKEDASVLTSLGQVLMYQSREREAIPHFRRSVALDSTQFLPWLYLGNCYQQGGAPSDARQAWQRGSALAERAVMESPEKGYFRGFFGYLCARLGDSRRAQSEVAQALQASPQVSDVRWMAALTYQAIGQPDAALRVLAEATPEMLADLSRWPEAAPLVKDARFSQLLSAAKQQP